MFINRSITSIDFIMNNDSGRIAAGTRTGSILFYPVARKDTKIIIGDDNILEGHRSEVKAVSFSNDTLYSTDMHGKLREWVFTNKPYHAFLQYDYQDKNKGKLYQIRYNKKGELLTANNIYGLRLWNSDGYEVNKFSFVNKQASIVNKSDYERKNKPKPLNTIGIRGFDINEDLIVFSHNADHSGGRISLCESNIALCHKSGYKHAGVVVSISISPDGSSILTGGRAGKVAYWKIQEFKDSKIRYNPIILKDKRKKNGFQPVALSNRFIVYAGEDNKIEIRLKSNPKVLYKPLEGHQGPVTALAIYLSNNSVEMLASASMDGSIKLWNLENAEHERTLVDHRGPVYSIDVHDAKQLLASGGDDSIVRLWNLSHTDKEIRPLTLFGHTHKIDSVAISQNGDLVTASSLEGNSVKVLSWRTQTDKIAQDVCTSGLVTRNLSEKEWSQYIGSNNQLPYKKTCKDLPVSLD